MNMTERSYEQMNFEQQAQETGKLQTIQSVMNEESQPNIGSIENNEKKEVDKQLYDMNRAIQEIKANHQRQILEMKDFYDKQIDDLRQSKLGQTQMHKAE